MLDFVTVFEASSLEGEFDGFTRTVEDEEVQVNAEFNVNNQEVKHTVIENRDGVIEKVIKVDGEIVSHSEVNSPEEFVNTVARNTISSTSE